MKKEKNNSLIISIIIGSILISGSLVYLGSQIGKDKNNSDNEQVQVVDQEAIEQGIEAYIEKQEEEFKAEQEKTQQEQEELTQELAKKVPYPDESDHIRGNPEAKIALIEYSDFECPFCKQFHGSAQELVDTYPEDVQWIYRHFPLGFHDPLATQQALASECAAQIGGNEAFWEYTDKVYETTNSNGDGMSEEELYEIASEVGLNDSEFRNCLENEEYLADVEEDISSGSEAGVTGTPGNFMLNTETGEVRFIPGAYPFSDLEDILEELM